MKRFPLADSLMVSLINISSTNNTRSYIMQHTTRWLMLGIAITLVVLPGVAGTVLGKRVLDCYSPTRNGNTASVYGDWIENIDRVTAPAGVTVSITGKFNGLQNNTGDFAGKGRVDLTISTNNATPGTKTINLIDDPSIGFAGSTFSFTITVVAQPTVTSVDVPTPADPFQDITVTLHGTGLQGATDPATGTIVIDNLVPFVTVGGNASISSVRVLSSSSTSLQAKIFFTAMVQDATIELTLKSATNCNPLGVFITSGGGFKTRVRVKSTNIKNYVESITFPNGSTIVKNSVGTIFINLLFPAPGGGSTITNTTGRPLKRPGTLPGNITAFLQQLTANALGNSRVFFKFVPANAFEAVPNGTPFNATGFNEVRANAGEDIIPITFKVIDCLGGQPGQTNTVKIQTWMHTTNTNLPPNFVEQTFSVQCTQ